VKLTTWQAYELLEKHGSYITEICDRCGKGIGPVRFTRKDDPGVWCSRECRGDDSRCAIRKGGRPRKYESPKECRTAQTSQQRSYRAVSVWKKPPGMVAKTKDLQAQKTPLWATPLYA
jgi:hypothetical protein